MTRLILALFLAAVSAPPALEGAPALEAATVEVAVTGARSDDGQAVALLFASARGFPADTDRAAYSASAALEGGRATIRVPAVAPGTYSIVVFHDADGDGEIKRNLLGMPREGIGVTRFDGGRPRFGRTTVEVPASGARFTVGLNYR